MKKSMSLFLAALLACSGINNVNIKTEAAGEPVRILFTGNLNDHIDTFKTLDEENTTIQAGGYALLSSAIEEYSNENTVVLDAGNFSVGTMYGALNASEAPDLTLMKQMGYDAVTFGASDFTYGFDSFAAMLKGAGDIPQPLSANAAFGEGSVSSAVKEAWASAGVENYALIDAGEYTVGVFGITEPAEAFDESGAVYFTDPQEAAKEAVSDLEKRGADLTVCLYSTDHEDLNEFAEAVNADVIIVGSNQAGDTYQKAGNTVIVSTDAFGKTLGLLDIDPSDGSVRGYENIPISAEAFEADEELTEKITEYRNKVQEKVMKRFGLDTEKTAFKASYSLTTYDRLGTDRRYAEAADLVTDAMIEAYQRSSGDEAKPVSIITEDMITGTLFAGEVSANELFSLACKGMGSDGVPGYSLVHVYMRGTDLLALCEMDLMLNAGKNDQQFHFGRMRYEYSMNRPETNRVIDVYTEEADGYYIAATDDRLYPVITTAEILRSIPAMIEKTGNVLECNVYDETGRQITDYEVMTMRNGSGVTIKLWSAISAYMDHFDRGSDGIDVLPNNYKSARKQRIKTSSLNILKMFKHAGRATFDFYIKAIAIPVAVLAALNILVWLLNLKKRKEQAE